MTQKKFVILFVSILVGLLLMVQPESVYGDTQPYNLLLGQIVDYKKTQIQNELTYEFLDILEDNGNKQKVYFAHFHPDSKHLEMVLHDVNTGQDTFRSSGTVLAIAKDFEEKTGRKVYAAVNGDFFWQGAPIDHYIKNGQVVHAGLGNAHSINFAFNAKGDYVVGKVPAQVDSKLRIVKDNNRYIDVTVDKFNGEMPYNDQLSIYLPGQKMDTINTGKYLIKASQDTIDRNFALPLQGTVDRPTEGTIKTSEKITVPEGYFGIAINSMVGENDRSKLLFNELIDGRIVEVYKSPTGAFKNMEWGVGAKNHLVANGIVMPEPLKDGSSGTGNHPRTTVGVLVDGSFFVQVIDGRQSEHSVGITVPKQAQLAFDLGAKEAVELDGGGSSTFVLRIDDELVVVNRPSDGSLRQVSNVILIVEKVETNEEPNDDPNDVDPNEEEENGGNNGEDNRSNTNDKEKGWLSSKTFKVVSTSIVIIILVTGIVTHRVKRK